MGPKERDVAWTATALEQLIESLEYLAERAPAAAEALYEQAMSAAESLATLSERGRVVPELGRSTTRELLVGSHRLLYDPLTSRSLASSMVHATLRDGGVIASTSREGGEASLLVGERGVSWRDVTDRLGLAFALLVLGAGCNQVYGLDQTQLMPIEAGVIVGEDLDLDGIPDEFDDCLAPMSDAADDYDADGAPAATDLCPFDPDPVVDVDQDGLPDACDPFPKAGGDRRRCYMSFGSTDLNARLWKARDATNEWTSREGELFTKTPGATSGLVSTIELEAAAQTTFDAAVTLSNASAGTYAFRVWARAADAFDNQELGCELSGDPTSTRFAVVRGNDMDVPGGATTVFLPFPRSVPVRVRLTLAASGTGVDIRCAFAWAAVEGVVKARVDGMAPGRVAFGTENLQAAVSALAIYERDRVEPLP